MRRRSSSPRRAIADEAVHLAIAGLRLHVRGVAGEARDWIRERYAPFLVRRPATARAGTVTVQVKTATRWPRGRPPDWRVSRDGARFHIVAGPCHGSGDLDASRVELHAPPVPSVLAPSLLRVLCTIFLIERGGVLLHASAALHAGHAWVFCGPSGSGKTTIARLAGDRTVLSDETVAIVRGRGAYSATSTPFYGEGGPGMGMLNRRAPIRGLCFLRKADHFAHRRLGVRETIERAFPQVFLPKADPVVAAAVLERVIDVARNVPCFELSFARSPQLWEYLDALA